MKIWLITDTEFFNANLTKNGYRPKGFGYEIMKYWKRLVDDDDMIIHLGDVIISKRRSDMFTILKALSGTKILIRGNRDVESPEWYMENGFDFCCDGLQLGKVFLSHKPKSVLPKGVVLNVHGHLHNRYGKVYKAFPHCKLLAMEYTGYKPVEFSKFCCLDGKLRLKKARGAS